MPKIYIIKGYKARLTEKRLMGISPGETRNKLVRHSLPVESHRTWLILPVKSCSNTCKLLSTWEAYYRLGAWDFKWKPITLAPKILESLKKFSA